MSLFDNMMMGNSKDQKPANMKKTAKNVPSHSSNKEASNVEALYEELSEELSAEKTNTNKLPGLLSETLNKSQETSKKFKEEFSEGLMSDVSRFGIQSYSKAGITFEKLSDTQAKINYTGLLAKSGAQEVMGVYGFGSNQKWEDVSTLNMNKEGEGSYMGIIPVEQGKNINLAFKDTAENWDNNSGMNYTFVN